MAICTSSSSTNTSLVLKTINSALPAFSGAGVTYNDIAKMFLTPGWQSAAGNIYQEGMRLSNKIVVKYNIGHGYAHTFLNGINIYGFDGHSLKLLIANNGYYDFRWGDSLVKDETARLLSRFFEDQCRVNGCLPSDRDYISRVASDFVAETIKATESVGNYALASGQSSVKCLSR